MTWTARVAAFFWRRDNRCLLLHGSFLFFAGFSFFLAFYHVPWRDEAQAWLMARDLSIWGLFLEARHDGHPILWHLCLKAVQLTGADYRGMMLLNWGFMVGAVALLFYRSSLPLVARLVVALCPSCLLHTSFYARNYAISVFLIFMAATLYSHARKRPLLFASVLALIDNTNVFAAAVSVGIAFQFVLDQAFENPQQRFSVRPLYTKYLAANAVMLVGMLLLVAQLEPSHLPGDPAQGPRLIPHWAASGPLIIFVISSGLVFLRKGSGFSRVIGGVPAALLALVPTILYMCVTRHAFMLVAGIVYFVWVYFDDLLPVSPQGTSGMTHSRILAVGAILVSAFICQPAGLRLALKRDSYSREAAAAIINRGLDRPDTILVTTDPTFTTPLLLFFHHIKVTYGIFPFGPGPQSYADFLRTRMRDHVPTLEEMKPLVVRLAEENPAKSIVVISVASADHDLERDANYPLHLFYASDGPPPKETGESYRDYEWQGRR